MKNFLFTIFFFSFMNNFCQTSKTYLFNIELKNYLDAPRFTKNNDFIKYSGNNIIEKEFFSKYKIINFYQTYSNSKDLKSLNVYTIESIDSNLMHDLVNKFPDKFLKFENLTDRKLVLLNEQKNNPNNLYYPNDYGLGFYNPVINLGANLSQKGLDYINAPKAWYYTKGAVKIGISDGKVINNDLDLSSKVSYLSENLFNSFFACPIIDARHGTSVGAIAAAQGNNNHGITGVCPDCTIINAPYTQSYNGILALANAGAKVINMSWCYYYVNDLTYATGFVQSEQDIIDQIHNMGVVLVAAAGNFPSFSELAPNYHRYSYPASYNHVISVSSVNSKNKSLLDEQTGPIPTYGLVSWYVEDLISPNGATNYLENGYYPFYAGSTHTTNSKVDICAPGMQAPQYGSYLLNCPNFYGDGTSSSAPYVSGTVALMQTLNPCLKPDEIEDVLQLKSKNIESNPYNINFIGKIGSGKLETGDSVEFVDEMKKINGSALILNQNFNRFDFDLSTINNKLVISNTTFKEKCSANFIARNQIELLSGTDLAPNIEGKINLGINPNINITCLPVIFPSNRNGSSNLLNSAKTLSTIYPNPNKGSFSIVLGRDNTKDTHVSIFDVFGKLIYNNLESGNSFEINVPNFPSGVYIVKLSNDNYNESLKFVKE